MRVAVIGGGPSGLVTLKYLKSAHQYLDVEPVDVRLFEAESEIGGVFQNFAYEGAELVSSRQLTTFSDFRMPNLPDFLKAEQYCAYLQAYCKDAELTPYIKLGHRVTGLERRKPNGHVVHYQVGNEEAEWHCDAVAICSGLHASPNVPSVPGVKHVKCLHSADVKSKRQFGKGKNILILGAGESGMDLSALLVKKHTVTLCHQKGFHVAPKRSPQPVWFSFWGKGAQQNSVPYDVSAARFGDSAYVHPLLRKWPLAALQWAYYDRFAKWSVWLISGTMSGLDQWVGGIAPERYHASKIFFVKSTKAMPYISAPYRHLSNTLLNRVRSAICQAPLEDTHGRHIDLAPWVKRFKPDGTVEFEDNGLPEATVMRSKVCKPDVVIFATGYRPSFPFLDATYPRLKDANAWDIWVPGDPSVAFIGFKRPNIGAIPPTSEHQVQLWTLVLLKHILDPPAQQIDYHLRTKSENRGIDHESYAGELLLSAGTAPSLTLTRLWRTPKLFMCILLGSTVGPLSRLDGPWKWDGAQEVLETEIWETITRRSWFFGHMALSILPITIFGLVSIILHLLCGVVSVLDFLAYYCGCGPAACTGLVKQMAEQWKARQAVQAMGEVDTRKEGLCKEQERQKEVMYNCDFHNWSIRPMGVEFD